jgi:hypothetical protein
MCHLFYCTASKFINYFNLLDIITRQPRLTIVHTKQAEMTMLTPMTTHCAVIVVVVNAFYRTTTL